MMRFGVSVREYSENGKRFIRVNGLVCEVRDDIDRGVLLFNLLCCSLFLLKKCVG